MGGSKETKELTMVSFLTSPGAQVLLSICQSSLCVWLCDVQGCSGKFKDRGGSGATPSWPEPQVPNIIIFGIANVVNIYRTDTYHVLGDCGNQGEAGMRLTAGTSLAGWRSDAQTSETSNESSGDT